MIKQFSFKSRMLSFNSAVSGQDGSMMMIVLMLLVCMSLIGIASTNTSITENFIVRNTGIRKQNIHLSDASAMEVVQQVLDAGLENDIATTLEIDEITPGMPDCLDWVHDKTLWEGAGNLYEEWYDPESRGRLLTDDNNSRIPLSIQDEANGIQLLNDRSEVNGSIRYAMVGWAFKSAGGGGNINLAAGQPILRTANILSEYMSPDGNGVIRLTVGVEREFMY